MAECSSIPNKIDARHQIMASIAQQRQTLEWMLDCAASLVSHTEIVLGINNKMRSRMARNGPDIGPTMPTKYETN
jgi:hypothetical protein